MVLLQDAALVAVRHSNMLITLGYDDVVADRF